MHTGVIVGARNHTKNIYDGHATAEVSQQIEELTGVRPSVMIGDHGYRDPIGNPRLAHDGIAVVTSADLKRATKGTPAWRRLRRLISLRPRVEAVIGHLASLVSANPYFAALANPNFAALVSEKTVGEE